MMSLRLPSRLARLAGTALAAALAAAGASAQDLMTLYEAARQFDATYLAARAQAEAAPHAAARTRALKLPTLGLTASGTRSDVDPPANVSASNPSGARVGATTLNLQLRGAHPLFNRTADLTIAQAERRLDLARVDLDAAEQDLILRLAQAYFDVLAAQDALATARASKAAIAEQLASARRNFEVGTATITDTREAQARFDLTTAQEIAAENELRTRRLALDQLVGRPDVAPQPLAAPVTLPALAPAEPQAWVHTADANNPAVRRARIGLEVARLEIDKARAGHLPTVDAVATLTPTHANGRGAQMPGTSTAATVGVQMSLPLFAGHAVQNAVKESLALEEKSRHDLEAARRNAAQAAREAFFGVQSGQAQVRALEAAESSSQLALQATQLGYRVGVRVNLDVLNAQTQLFQTRRDLARARYDALLRSLRLRQAAGTLSAADLAALNQLVAR